MSVTDSARAQVATAQRALSEGDLVAADVAAGVAVILDPSNYWGWLVLGEVREKTHQPDRAQEAYRRAIELATPDGLGAYERLLRLEFATQDFSEAHLLTDALALAEESPQKRWHYSGLRFLAGIRALAAADLPEAETQLAAAYGFWPAHFDLSLFFDWVVAELERSDVERFPCLSYVRRVNRALSTELSYESELERLPDDTSVVEIGAMDGVWADPLRPFIAERGWQAVLVEPTEGMFERLSANYAGFPNVRVVRAAVTDHAGELTLTRLLPDAPGVGDWAESVSSASKQLMRFYEGHTVEEVVPAIRFDDLGVDRVDVLQIDTEGHDWIVFEQVDLDARQVRVAQVEIIWLMPEDRLKVFAKLDAAGFVSSFDGTNVCAVRRES